MSNQAPNGEHFPDYNHLDTLIEQVLFDKSETTREARFGEFTDTELHLLQPLYPADDSIDRIKDVHIAHEQGASSFMGKLVLSGIDHLLGKPKVVVTQPLIQTTRHHNASDLGIDASMEILEKSLQGEIRVKGESIQLSRDNKLIKVSIRNNGAHNGSPYDLEGVELYYSPQNRMVAKSFILPRNHALGVSYTSVEHPTQADAVAIARIPIIQSAATDYENILTILEHFHDESD